MAENRQIPRWWLQPDDAQRAHVAFQQLSSLQDIWRNEYWLDQMRERIYLNREFHYRGRYSRALKTISRTGLTVTRLNVVKTKLDTITNKVAKQPAAVRIDPDNAKYSLKRRSRKLRKFLAGKWHEQDAVGLNQHVFRDMGINRTGVIAVCNHFGDIKLERVRRRDLFVDPREARDGNPRQMFRRHRIPRELLLELFSRDQAAVALIKRANRATFSPEDEALGYQHSNQADLVEVGEAWHLRSGPEAKDGMHGMFLETGPLLFEPYERRRFPFAMCHWSNPMDSIWGASSLVDDLEDVQCKINETVRDVQHDLFFGANTHVFAPRNADINWQHFGKRRGVVVIEYGGSVKPEVMAPNPVSSQKIEFLRFLLEQAEELIGVPNTASAARNPVGAGASGIAHQEQEDRESERHFDKDLSLGLMWRDVAEICIDTAKDIAADPKAQLSALWSEGSFMQSIDWKDVDMDRDQFVIQLEPANFLPDTRAGKLAATEALAQQGVIKGSAVPSLLDFPDLKKVTLEITAPRDAIERLIEVLDDEDEEMPSFDPHLNQELLEQMLLAHYNRALAEEAPGEVLKRFRDYIRAVQGEKRKQVAAQAALAPPAAPGQPDIGGALPPGAAPLALPGAGLPGVGGV